MTDNLIKHGFFSKLEENEIIVANQITVPIKKASSIYTRLSTMSKTELILLYYKNFYLL